MIFEKERIQEKEHVIMYANAKSYQVSAYKVHDQSDRYKIASARILTSKFLGKRNPRKKFSSINYSSQLQMAHGTTPVQQRIGCGLSFCFHSYPTLQFLEPKRIGRLFQVNKDQLLHDAFTIKVSELAKKTITVKRSPLKSINYKKFNETILIGKGNKRQ